MYAYLGAKYPRNLDYLKAILNSRRPKTKGVYYGVSSAYAVSAAKNAASAVLDEEFAFYAIEQAISALDTAPATASVYPKDLWRCIEQDERLVDAGISTANLVARPLWGDFVVPWFSEHWEYIEDALPKDQDWDVWTRWYRDILDGVPHEEAYDLTFAGWDGEKFLDIWKDGPAQANRWIKEHLPKAPEKPGIPAPQPATLQPILVGEIVTLSKAPPGSDLAEAEIAAALAALKARFERLLKEIEGATNIDPRFPAILRDFIERIPASIPDLATLYDFGHEFAALRGYEATVIAEWPSALSPRYSGTLVAFDLTLQKFPDWRKYSAALGPEISPQQAEQVLTISQIVTSTLRLDGPSDHIDSIVPATLEALTNSGEQVGGELTQMANAGRTDIARDELESINNLLKIEASNLPEPTTGDKIVSALTKEIKEAGGDIATGAREAKSNVFKGVGNALIYGPVAVFVLIAANASGVPVFPWLLKNFPTQFGWLEPFLRRLGLL